MSLIRVRSTIHREGFPFGETRLVDPDDPDVAAEINGDYLIPVHDENETQTPTETTANDAENDSETPTGTKGRRGSPSPENAS
jgi:hypothetical protein